MKKYQIMGWFWGPHVPQDIERLYSHANTFSGMVEADEKGEFSGSTWDKYGEARIKGKLCSSGLLSFEKEYLNPSLGGCPNPVSYELHAVQVPTTEAVETGAGWRGIYSMMLKEKRVYGKAACMFIK